MTRPHPDRVPDGRFRRRRIAMSGTAMVLLCALALSVSRGAAQPSAASITPQQTNAAQTTTVAQTGTTTASNASNAKGGSMAVFGPKVDPNAKMLLESDQVSYDTGTNVVTATGNVQIYYDGNTLTADKVVVDRTKNTVQAVGRVRITDSDGNVVTAESADLTDDFKNGVMETVRAYTGQRTMIAANKATREGGETTVFSRGVYTACETCTSSDKAPIWQIKAKKITHKEDEHMLYYHEAQLDFLGVPVAYMPYMSQPDPTVKRKSGFLMPNLVAGSDIGYGARIPYFWAPAPNYDLTVAATPLSRQGVLLDATWRQRFVTGQYTIQGSGISQADPSAFGNTSANIDQRGFARTTGEFLLNGFWKWGWDLGWTSDPSYLTDYGSVGSNQTELTSTVYLNGVRGQNYFDLRAYAYRVSQVNMLDTSLQAADGFSAPGLDQQSKQPIVHPVWDYDGVWGDPIAGGELSWKSNLTSLTRETTDAYSVTTPDGTIDRFRGIEGTFNRYSLYAQWRRQYVDGLGQIFTPFAYAQGDIYQLDNADPAVTRLTDQSVVVRAMPAVGAEYRYPWLVASSWGSQVFEPIAQIIARPDEQNIGDLPNEDSQSIIYDETTLFQWDKFSGFDRTEGGTRANVGLQYSLQMPGVGALHATAGQSFQLAGRNSYQVPDILYSTADSGLQTTQSDYVAGAMLTTEQAFKIGSSFRFASNDFSVNSAEIAVSNVFGPLTGQVIYAYLAKQPDLGVDKDREEIHPAASLQLIDQWRTFGAIRYDMIGKDVVGDSLGVAYDDDAFSVSLAVSEDRSGSSGQPVSRTAYLRVGLRTLGDISTSSSGF